VPPDTNVFQTEHIFMLTVIKLNLYCKNYYCRSCSCQRWHFCWTHFLCWLECMWLPQ